jgi:hypothetical protein
MVFNTIVDHSKWTRLARAIVYYQLLKTIYTQTKQKKTIEILTAIQNSISRDLDVSCSLPFVIADTFAAYRNEGHLFNEYQNSSNIATKKSSVIQ